MLFHDTIFYNLHYGDLSKSREEVMVASKMADLHESVSQWPKAYETQVLLFLNLLKQYVSFTSTPVLVNLR